MLLFSEICIFNRFLDVDKAQSYCKLIIIFLNNTEKQKMRLKVINFGFTLLGLFIVNGKAT